MKQNKSRCNYKSDINKSSVSVSSWGHFLPQILGKDVSSKTSLPFICLLIFRNANCCLTTLEIWATFFFFDRFNRPVILIFYRVICFCVLEVTGFRSSLLFGYFCTQISKANFQGRQSILSWRTTQKIFLKNVQNTCIVKVWKLDNYNGYRYVSNFYHFAPKYGDIATRLQYVTESERKLVVVSEEKVQ